MIACRAGDLARQVEGVKDVKNNVENLQPLPPIFQKAKDRSCH